MAEPLKERSSIEVLMHAGPTQQQLEQFKGPTNQTNLPGNEMPNISKFQSGETVPQVGGAEKLSVNMKMMAGANSEDDDEGRRINEEAKRRHEMNMQGMYGERGRRGFVRKFFDSVEQLKTIKEDTTDIDKLTTQILEAIEDIDKTEKEMKPVDNSGNFSSSRNQLKEAKDKLITKIDSKIEEKKKTGTKPEEIEPYSKVREDLRKKCAIIEKEYSEKAIEKRLEKERERVKKNYENLVHVTLDETNSLNTIIEHFRDAYPYESRYMLMFFDDFLENVNDLLRDPENLDEEGVALIKMLKRDFTWCSAVARVSESMGPAYQNFFDGETVVIKQSGNHTDILAEDFIRYLDDKIDGLELTDEERRLVAESIMKESIDKELDKIRATGKNPTEDQRRRIIDSLVGKEKLGLREKAIELQDAYGKVLYDVIAVGQKNMEPEDDQKEKGERYAVLDTEEYGETLEFLLSEVFNAESIYDPTKYFATIEDMLNGKFRSVELREEFIKFFNEKDASDPHKKKGNEGTVYLDKAGLGHEVKKAYLNPFCMDKSNETAVRATRARFQELVLNYEKYFGEKGLKGIHAKYKDHTNREEERKEVWNLIRQIQKGADSRLVQWESLDLKDWDFRLTDMVMRNINILETGLLATGDLGWSWRYSEKKFPIQKTDDEYIIGPDGKPATGPDGKKIVKTPGKYYIDIDGVKIFEEKDSKIYTQNFWNLIKKGNLIFKANTLGVDGDLFYPEAQPLDASGRINYVRKIISKDAYTKEEYAALSKLAMHSFTNNEGNFDDLKRIQLSDKDAKDKDDNPIPQYQFIVKRVSELGSIYETKDITTLVFWARHIVDYDTFAYSRSTLLFPSMGWYREMWEEQAPYWRPTLEYFAVRDSTLMNMLGWKPNSTGILSDGNILEKEKVKNFYKIGATGLQPSMYGKFNYKVRDYIKENAWAFVTPWTNSPGSPEGEYDLVMPMFLPTSIPDINFWRAVSLEGPAVKVKDYKKKTMWHERLRGKTYSEFEWKNMDVNKNSWEVNNTFQMERWLGPLVTPHVFNRMTAAEVEKFYNEPNGLSEKEGGKRAGLSLRGSSVEDGVIRASVFSQNKVFASVGITGIMGVSSDKIKSVTTELSLNNADLNAALNEWRKVYIAPWINTFLDFPYHVKGVDNYPGTASQAMLASYIQARRIIASAIVNGYGRVSEVNQSIGNAEKRFIQ
jgi:hypothetical protein